ncbi:hypothetical protein BGZ60DRAFT_532364 [Tricladium varicosporioides]|nr:hypothetical protein BGZ60DRAFT_532364 [Hymenoscyphus varicosporioides]
MGSPSNVVHGYPTLANFIAHDEDQSTSIYRSHRKLSSRNLLYLEAELSELEHELEILDAEDLRGSFEGKKFARSWKMLYESSDPHHKKQAMLIMAIRVKIKEFHKALILEQAVANMPRPHPQTVALVDTWTKRWLNSGKSILADASGKRLDDRKDLVALRAPPDHDYLVRFARRYLRIFFVHEGFHDGVGFFSDAEIVRAVNIFSMLIAAGLLIGAIVNLYLVHNPNIRLGLIGGYTAAFAFSVGALTSARRTEVYACTAAYAAVLVVFIQTESVEKRHVTSPKGAEACSEVINVRETEKYLRAEIVLAGWLLAE